MPLLHAGSIGPLPSCFIGFFTSVRHGLDYMRHLGNLTIYKNKRTDATKERNFVPQSAVRNLHTAVSPPSLEMGPRGFRKVASLPGLPLLPPPFDTKSHLKRSEEVRNCTARTTRRCVGAFAAGNVYIAISERRAGGIMRWSPRHP